MFLVFIFYWLVMTGPDLPEIFSYFHLCAFTLVTTDWGFKIGLGEFQSNC